VNSVEAWEIKGYTLEYIDEIHQYLVDGLCIPSITQIIKVKFGNKYDGISKEVLQKAANKGTEMHEAIELYEKEGKESDIPELKNYKFLKKHYKWEVIESEIPIILFWNSKGNRLATSEEIEEGIATPIAAGRLDQLIKIDVEKGINDLKRTSVFDKNYVAVQTNLYKSGYEQSYSGELDFVAGTHLRNNTRKFYKLPVNKEYAESIIKQYLEMEKEK
jgi:hypothetical protein